MVPMREAPAGPREASGEGPWLSGRDRPSWALGIRHAGRTSPVLSSVRCPGEEAPPGDGCCPSSAGRQDQATQTSSLAAGGVEAVHWAARLDSTSIVNSTHSQ